MIILIVGGSGGIGQALVKRFASEQPKAQIYATYRTTKPNIESSHIHWVELDASREEDVRALAKQLPNVDMLINATGLLHTPDKLPEKSIQEFDPDFFNENLKANTLPTLLLAKHFAKALKAKQTTYFVALSARIGSISDNQLGGWISYRSAKAALNMALKTISIEWRYKLPNCCVLAFHPGTTDTALSVPFQKNVPPGKLFTADFVAQSLIDLIQSKQASDSGGFYSYDGSAITW
ncbi:SDR family NAD(P)-dependent oxidoreductase [Pseudoalteromonas sp. DL2-H2.2]|uniref:C factor cell-cell signaling protein n=1 Tax=Pseudoalteromonas rubra TaxID=43658 RepID=A0A0F4QHP3_9GAMM|nr:MULTISPECIES: SDR family NAD(P)-dependent oxidoreductase [Pseudoalteromonas]KJZ06849.1 C factor cell-cell signaling protein [Pseudoalteromonas rubra]MCF2906993.1 SDR family NAD(P)-dependent oxidoreductase [Pseudoalteromonas sp. DL2-H2.2]